MPRKIGIIAGGGAMPSLIAKECMKSGQSPFIAILEGQSSSANYAQLPHATFRIGAVGAIISKLRKEGIKDMRVVIKSKNIKSLSVFKSFGGKIVNDKFTEDSVELMLYF